MSEGIYVGTYVVYRGTFLSTPNRCEDMGIFCVKMEISLLAVEEKKFRWVFTQFV